jgi:hypothetical protein
MLPCSDNNSRNNRSRGHIIASHLSCRSPSSMPTGLLDSHSRIIGLLTLSL